MYPSSHCDGGFFIGFVIQVNNPYISADTKKTAITQTKKPLAVVSLGELGSNERTLSSKHKCRLDQTGKLLEG